MNQPTPTSIIMNDFYEKQLFFLIDELQTYEETVGDDLLEEPITDLKTLGSITFFNKFINEEYEFDESYIENIQKLIMFYPETINEPITPQQRVFAYNYLTNYKPL